MRAVCSLCSGYRRSLRTISEIVREAAISFRSPQGLTIEVPTRRSRWTCPKSSHEPNGFRPARSCWLDLTPIGPGEGWDGMPDVHDAGPHGVRHHDKYRE